MTVHCRIMKIDIEKFSADLTCRTSDLMDKNNEWKLPKDTYYDFDAEAADHKQEEELKRRQQRTSESSGKPSGERKRLVALLGRGTRVKLPVSLSCSLHQAGHCPSVLPQHQLQAGREDDGDDGPR